jgi:hypothetical protein
MSILFFADGVKKGKQKVDDLKAALLSTGEYIPERLFPEVFGPVDDDFDGPVVVDDGSDYATAAVAEAEDNGGVQYDYSQVEWLSPGTENKMEIAELMALQEALMANSTVSLNETEEAGWQ